MPLFTSSQFASASASGTDWRDTSKAILEQLETVRTSGDNFNFGFLYISDYLADDAASILNLFRSVLGIENWTGCTGIGICGSGEEYIDQPAISAMIGYFDESEFCIFPLAGADISLTGEHIKSWLEHNDSMLVYVHGDPTSETDPALTLRELDNTVGGYVTGGLSSARTKHVQYANDVCEGGVTGVIFSQDIKVATALSQGCTPIGAVHTVTRGAENIIRELDEEKAITVFENDLRSMAIKKIDQDHDQILIDQESLENKDAVPEEFKHLFKGEVHIAFPVSGSDQKDYLVRSITGLDPHEGSISVSQNVSSGETAMFVHRDEKTLEKDLCAMLIGLRERVQKETGSFEPKGALYVSCVARAFSDKGEKKLGEMKLIKDIIGEVPLAGFYASGETAGSRLYNYTGILTLFL
ncbi:MAG: hypothetical protein DHS20C02_15070 [Micavibrio sp.]|nr:MAG: hypothetical protein DHS20C02_15070 [Micavibrio sp.]